MINQKKELSKKELNQYIFGMKQAYSEGKNVMEFARTFLKFQSGISLNRFSFAPVRSAADIPTRREILSLSFGNSKSNLC